MLADAGEVGAPAPSTHAPAPTHHREELSAADGRTPNIVRVPVRTERLFAAPATRIVTNRAAGCQSTDFFDKCVLLWESTAEALAGSDSVWLVQRMVVSPSRCRPCSTTREEIKDVVDRTASV